MEEFSIESHISSKGQRLDKFLSLEISKIRPEISRSRIKGLIEDKQILELKTKSTTLNCDYKIKGDEEFQITIPDSQPLEITPKNIALEIAFEDDHMLVINKPAGLITHPGNGSHDATLVHALLFHCKDSLSGINGIMRPGIVHRLDKDTSGLMVVAKNDLAHQDLAGQIQSRVLKRNYLAICYGVPKPTTGQINKNIDRSRFNRLKMTVTKSSGRSAITNYCVKEIYQKGAFSLVECRLDTGRTHQIRVHMTAIGHSLIGDKTYGNSNKTIPDIENATQTLINNFPRQALHSYKISFLHPVSKEEMTFETDLPEDIKTLKTHMEKAIYQ